MTDGANIESNRHLRERLIAAMWFGLSAVIVNLLFFISARWKWAEGFLTLGLIPFLAGGISGAISGYKTIQKQNILKIILFSLLVTIEAIVVYAFLVVVISSLDIPRNFFGYFALVFSGAAIISPVLLLYCVISSLLLRASVRILSTDD